MKRWWAILPLAAFALLVVIGFQRLSGNDPAPSSFASPLRPSPEFDVPGLDNPQVKLSDFKGRPILVNFWATWCGPCKLEHPLLVETGAEIVAAVERGLARDPRTLPALERGARRNFNQATVELLKVLLKMVCESEGVAAKVVATVDDLEAIASDDAADVQALQGWRRELFGNRALALKHGRLALAMDGGRVVGVSRDGSNA